MKKQVLIVGLISIWVFIFLLFTKVVKAERFEDHSQTFKTIDAAVEWDNSKAYFFKGGQYVRYDIRSDRADPGYPKPINNETWSGIPWTDGIDAVVNWYNGKAYFFKGGQYIRYDVKTDRADPGYPKPINSQTWSGISWTDGIDTAVNWRNGKAYIFKGMEYVRIDISADRVDPGYPKPINNETWPGLTVLFSKESGVNR